MKTFHGDLKFHNAQVTIIHGAPNWDLVLGVALTLLGVLLFAISVFIPGVLLISYIGGAISLSFGVASIAHLLYRLRQEERQRTHSR